MMLKAKREDNGKGCNDCMCKEWKGLNHTKFECYTKKHKKAKAKAAKAQNPKEAGDSDDEEVTIKAIRIGKTTIEHQECYEYAIASTHHFTNKYERLTDVQHNLSINAGAKSTCKVMETLVF